MLFGHNLSRRVVVSLSVWMIASIHAANAFGAVTVTAHETGEGVVFAGSGTLDLDSAMPLGAGIRNMGAVGSTVLFVGPATPTSIDDYFFDDFSGPLSIGPVPRSFATTGSGDLFGLAFDLPTPGGGRGALQVSEGYVSETPLSGTSTHAGQTLRSLSLTPGAYTWSWGSGDNADSFTLNVVPEPSSVLVSLIALVGVCLLRKSWSSP